jgi:peroxiredoxin
MTGFLALGAMVCVTAGAGAWLFFALLRQNGRLLVRVEALEAIAERLSADAMAARVAVDRSLATSRINRAGLAAGSVAPDFRLPTLDGDHAALSDYAGSRLLLVFSDPDCAPCTALLPQLQPAAERAGVSVLVISRGGYDVNRRKLAEAKTTLRVALQAQWEISRLYGKFSTPIGYLIDEHGRTVTEVAGGGAAILALLGNHNVAVRPDSAQADRRLMH